MTDAETETETEGKPRRTWTDAQRAAHANRRRRGPSDSRPDSELIAEDVVEEAVANVITLAGFAMPLAPYTALTLAGVPHPDDDQEHPTRWLVRSRARMAGDVLLEHAKRNRRVLAAIARFNLIFKNIELVEVAGSVVASAAVDAHVVDPHAVVKLPGGAELPILAPAIGDTIDYMDSQQPEVAAQYVGRQVRRTESADGVTEPGRPFDPTRDVPSTPEEARIAREALAARDARIANGGEKTPGPPPTLRREGQAVIEGGVEGT